MRLNFGRWLNDNFESCPAKFKDESKLQLTGWPTIRGLRDANNYEGGAGCFEFELEIIE